MKGIKEQNLSMLIFEEQYHTMIVLVGLYLLVISGSAVGLVSDLPFSRKFLELNIRIVITLDFVNSKKGEIRIEPESISYLSELILGFITSNKQVAFFQILNSNLVFLETCHGNQKRVFDTRALLLTIYYT